MGFFTSAIIAASGNSTRMGFKYSKQFIDLNGKTVIERTLMAFENCDLIDEIKVKVNQFGLEAQPPLILAMVNGIKNYTEDNLVEAISRKEDFFDLLSEKYEMFEKTPTGVMVSEDSLKNQLEKLNVETELSKKDCCSVSLSISISNEPSRCFTISALDDLSSAILVSHSLRFFCARSNAS